MRSRTRPPRAARSVPRTSARRACPRNRRNRLPARPASRHFLVCRRSHYGQLPQRSPAEKPRARGRTSRARALSWCCPSPPPGNPEKPDVLQRMREPWATYRYAQAGGFIIESATFLPCARFLYPPFDLLELPRKSRRKQPVTLLGNEHLVFYAHAESPLGDVDAWLHGDHRTRRKRAQVIARVVHVEPDEMPEAVDELVEVPGLAQGDLRRSLQVLHRRPRAHRGKDVLLRLVHRPVRLRLLVGEPARHGERPRHVGGIAPVLRGGIHDDQITVAEHPRVLIPVQDGAVLAASDDAAVRKPGRSRGEEGVLELGLDVALGNSRDRGAGGRLVSFAGDGDGLLHERELLRTVRLAQPLEELALVDELHAQRRGGLAERRDVVALVLERGRGEDGEAPRLLADGDEPLVPLPPPHRIDPELLLERGTERIARPRPPFRLGIPGAQEQGALHELALRMEHDPAALLVDARQPEEIRVLPVIVRDPGGLALRGERGRASVELLHDPGLPVAVDRRGERRRRLRIRMRKCGSSEEESDHGGEGSTRSPLESRGTDDVGAGPRLSRPPPLPGCAGAGGLPASGGRAAFRASRPAPLVREAVRLGAHRRPGRRRGHEGALPRSDPGEDLGDARDAAPLARVRAGPLVRRPGRLRTLPRGPLAALGRSHAGAAVPHPRRHPPRARTRPARPRGACRGGRATHPVARARREGAREQLGHAAQAFSVSRGALFRGERRGAGAVRAAGSMGPCHPRSAFPGGRSARGDAQVPHRIRARDPRGLLALLGAADALGGGAPHRLPRRRARGGRSGRKARLPAPLRPRSGTGRATREERAPPARVRPVCRRYFAAHGWAHARELPRAHLPATGLVHPRGAGLRSDGRRLEARAKSPFDRGRDRAVRPLSGLGPARRGRGGGAAGGVLRSAAREGSLTSRRPCSMCPRLRTGDGMARDLGTKYTCFKCATKFYDLKKPAPTCPKCGADQREAPIPKVPTTRQARAAAAREEEELAAAEEEEKEGDEDEEEEKEKEEEP